MMSEHCPCGAWSSTGALLAENELCGSDCPSLKLCATCLETEQADDSDGFAEVDPSDCWICTTPMDSLRRAMEVA